MVLLDVCAGLCVLNLRFETGESSTVSTGQNSDSRVKRKELFV